MQLGIVSNDVQTLTESRASPKEATSKDDTGCRQPPLDVIRPAYTQLLFRSLIAYTAVFDELATLGRLAPRRAGAARVAWCGRLTPCTTYTQRGGPPPGAPVGTPTQSIPGPAHLGGD